MCPKAHFVKQHLNQYRAWRSKELKSARKHINRLFYGIFVVMPDF